MLTRCQQWAATTPADVTVNDRYTLIIVIKKIWQFKMMFMDNVRQLKRWYYFVSTSQNLLSPHDQSILLVYNTHTHMHWFNGRLPGEPGLGECTLNFSASVPMPLVTYLTVTVDFSLFWWITTWTVCQTKLTWDDCTLHTPCTVTNPCHSEWLFLPACFCRWSRYCDQWSPYVCLCLSANSQIHLSKWLNFVLIWFWMYIQDHFSTFLNITRFIQGFVASVIQSDFH